ncbi:hypothetical protein DAETH_11690 [Deinococcus aetherius]|uniref:YCII-related domain-containing protein n=1 Tax=Deinococcus aetherius TaxID=200252 RepID=A0ABM8ABQ7_9DEIO|nr:hypothetical protein [Deinococcus aetherius]BDP41200.1 hypothetical protein DAETH_11690 [Deinococcus aetherius]
MPTFFAVWRFRGTAWNAALPMRQQALWEEHAAFMDALTTRGFVVLGGPLGPGEEILLVVRARSGAAVHARLAADPWNAAGFLVTGRVEPWTILLDGLLDGRAGPEAPEG